MINKVILVGNLGTDVEIHIFENGNKIGKAAVATSESWKDKQTGEKKQATTWHNVIFQGAKAELAEKYLSKGDKVYLEGKITNRSYEQDGITKYVTEIYVYDMRFLSTKKEQQPAGASSPTDEVPF